MSTRTSVRKALVGMLAAIVFLTGNLAARAEVAVDVLLRTISSYEFTTEDRLTPIIEELNYSPRSPSLWRSFPAARKLATVYWAAEVGSKVPGDGMRALAAIAKKMSVRFDSLRNNPAVSSLIDSQDLSRPFRFSIATVQKAMLVLVPPEAQRIILALSPYVEGGHLGGTYGILVRIFDLNSNTAYSILADSNSVEEALLRGVNEVPSYLRNEKLRRLIAEAKSQYPALAKASSVIAAEGALRSVESSGLVSTGQSDEDPVWDCVCVPSGQVVGHNLRKSECRPLRPLCK